MLDKKPRSYDLKSFNKFFPLAAHCSKRSGNGSAEMFAKHLFGGLLQSYLSTGINKDSNRNAWERKHRHKTHREKGKPT